MHEQQLIDSDLQSQAAPVLGRVLCGVDGSPSSLEAVRQAAVLAGPRGVLELVCVRYSEGYGPNAQATITEQRAESVLDVARDAVKELGVSCECSVVSSRERADALIERLADCDLVAVGPHVRSRAGGILLGSTASTLLHRSPKPVFLARRPKEGEWSPTSILVASDCSPEATAAVEMAARIGAAHSSEVVLLLSAGAARRDEALMRALASQAATLGDACGTEVVVLTPDGDAHERIPALAEQYAVRLVVVGSRGTTGLKSLASVSERVAHRARCSVLVTRGSGSRSATAA